MKIPLLSDLTHQIAKDYGVFLEDQGHTLRYDITKQSPGVGYPH
jgi:alkyl hydroperoxide reductase subunit AhpC